MLEALRAVGDASRSRHRRGNNEANLQMDRLRRPRLLAGVRGAQCGREDAAERNLEQEGADAVCPNELQAAAVNGRVYAIGGGHIEMKDGKPLDDLTNGYTEEYDPAADKWRERAPMPEGGTHNGIAALDGKITSRAASRATGTRCRRRPCMPTIPRPTPGASWRRSGPARLDLGICPGEAALFRGSAPLHTDRQSHRDGRPGRFGTDWRKRARSIRGCGYSKAMRRRKRRWKALFHGGRRLPAPGCRDAQRCRARQCDPANQHRSCAEGRCGYSAQSGEASPPGTNCKLRAPVPRPARPPPWKEKAS